MIILIRLTILFLLIFLHAMLWLSLPQGLFASCRGRTAHVQTLSTFSFDVGDRKQPCRKLSNLLKRTNGWRRTSSINSSDFIIEAFHRNWNQIWGLENQTITQPPIYLDLTEWTTAAWGLYLPRWDIPDFHCSFCTAGAQKSPAAAWEGKEWIWRAAKMDWLGKTSGNP